MCRIATLFAPVILILSVRVTGAVWRCKGRAAGAGGAFGSGDGAGAVEVEHSGSGSGPKLTEYPTYHCGYGARTSTLIGIYMNTGTSPTSRSIGQLTTGVNVTIPQKINFEKLKEDVKNHFAGHGVVAIKTDDLHEVKNEESTVEIPAGSAVVVVQLTAECAVKKKNRENYGDRSNFFVEIPHGLMLYSGPIIAATVNLSVQCTDKDFPSIQDAIENEEAHPIEKTIEFREGVWFKTDEIKDLDKSGQNVVNDEERAKLETHSWLDPEPDPREEVHRKDDTTQLIVWLVKQAVHLSPSPATGLNWSPHPISFARLGRVKKEFKLDIPPNRWARAFQAVSSCAPFKVYGWAFRTWYTNVQGAEWCRFGQECKSLEIQPVCMTVYDCRPGTPAALLYNSECQDTFVKPSVDTWRGEKEDERKVTFILEGPFVHKIDENFKKVFLEKVRSLGASGRTGFDWATVDNLNLYVNKNETTIQVTGSQAVLQLKIECGEYKLSTDMAAIVEKDRHGDCVKITGVALTCPQVETWIY